MKINQILESNYSRHDPEEIRHLLYRDCREIMMEYRSTAKRIYRGAHKDSAAYRATVRTNRWTTDTPMEFQEAADDYFVEKFGVPLRSSSLFTSCDPHHASNYGNVYVICPIGEYSMYASEKVNDFYSDFVEGALYDHEQEMHRKYGEHPTAKQMQEHTTQILDDLQYKRYPKVSGLPKTNEVMLHCTDYYAIQQNLFEKMI